MKMSIGPIRTFTWELLEELEPAGLLGYGRECED